MLSMHNEAVKTVENAILSGASVYSHMVQREMEDLAHATDRQTKALQSWQNHWMNQTVAFWSFWFPQR